VTETVDIAVERATLLPRGFHSPYEVGEEEVRAEEGVDGMVLD